MSKQLVEISNLTIVNKKRKGQSILVKGIDLSIPKGKIVGIVGESGSGKSLSMKSLMGILPKGLEASYDRFELDGKQVRNPKVLPLSMIFQDPMTSLNPLRTVGYHLQEVLRRFQPKLTKEERDRTIHEMLEKVGIPNPELRLKQFPFEFSGGMRQRIMIAMALLTKPDMLIADEPTTALDVTIQTQILALLKELQEQLGLTVVIVSHDFSVIAGICDLVYVMRNGLIVEHGTVDSIFSQPLHAYTQSLLRAARLEASLGAVLADSEDSQLIQVSPGHWVRKEEKNG
ncbi:TPA: ABC transporter ATP-binding protein [Streptococcus suis]|uniref:ABC transporter ATP-binding protein n=1 Tax=Streptococcus suis TaxID=1307 RepID=UPI00040CABD2|nr:ABC transporter ATP-binding protein [Streptococcus suis]HEM3174172.1 ABC transporter ATP-binding protein [Streptococcus suis]HEM4060671.1 ABC transporter ATP-binding protein [Streptococcus suis]